MRPILHPQLWVYKFVSSQLVRESVSSKCQFLEGLTLSAKERNRLHILNGVLERYWSVQEAAFVLRVGGKQVYRIS